MRCWLGSSLISTGLATSTKHSRASKRPPLTYPPTQPPHTHPPTHTPGVCGAHPGVLHPVGPPHDQPRHSVAEALAAGARVRGGGASAGGVWEAVREGAGSAGGCGGGCLGGWLGGSPAVWPSCRPQLRGNGLRHHPAAEKQAPFLSTRQRHPPPSHPHIPARTHRARTRRASPWSTPR